jgi:hypothetical protein
LTNKAQNMVMANEIGYSGLGVDSEIKPLLRLEGVTLRACQCYTLWIHAFTAHQIAPLIEIPDEQVEADIALIKRLLPAAKLAQHMKERNEILESQNQFSEKRQRFRESLTRPVDSYLAEGRDPAKALREFREFINADTAYEIQDLREKDANIGGAGNRDIGLDRKSQPMPPLQGEDTNADVPHIRAILSAEAAAQNTRKCDNISTAKEKPQIAHETPAHGLSTSAETLLGLSGLNPVDVPQMCREGDEVPPYLISDLRKRSGNRNIAAEEDDLAEEREHQLIAALRQKDKAPAKATKIPESYYPTGMASIDIDMLEKEFARADKRQSPGNLIPSENGKKGSPRITIRASSELRNRLEETAKRLGIGLSDVVRELLELGLESGSDTGGKTTAANFAILPEAFQYSAPYRAWCGDLRIEYKKRFLALVALGHETAQRWPRTEWVRQLFLALLPLQKYLEDGSVRRD